MELVIKTNKDITYEELEKLYDIFEKNMKKVCEETWIAKMYNDQFKFNWIDSKLNSDITKNYIFMKRNEIVGYIIITENDENFIEEFQIVEQYQGDRNTFKQMIISILPNLNLAKLFTGNILMVNQKSQDVFRHLGARINNGKYCLDIERLKSWIATKK